MALKELNLKVVSYCDIPEDIAESSWRLKEASSDCFIKWSLSTVPDIDSDLDNWLYNEYPELIGTDFLIEMDY